MLRPVIVLSLVTALIIGGQIMGSKTINCVISKDNPYESMPMVCKVVLQKP